MGSRLSMSRGSKARLVLPAGWMPCRASITSSSLPNGPVAVEHLSEHELWTEDPSQQGRDQQHADKAERDRGYDGAQHVIDGMNSA